ncbi:MAG: chemotaxis protein CheW [Rhodomicrobium sp.]
MKNAESKARCCKDGHPAGEDIMKKTSFFIVFVNDNAFGLEVKEAQTIFKAGYITPIPLVREEVAGFINLRGKVVVAVSLRRRLGAPDTGELRESIAIGLEKDNEHFALLVDRVGDVLSIPESARVEIPRHCDPAQCRFTRDLYAFESRLIPILDVARLFDFAS